MGKKRKKLVKISNSSPTQTKKQSKTKTLSLSKVEQFSGPIPPPRVLADYELIEPGFAGRIITMAEEQAAHRKAMEKVSLEAEIKATDESFLEAKRGQRFGLVIGIVAIVAGVICAYLKQPWPGSIIGGGGVVGLVTAFILGRSQNKQDAENHK